MRYLSVCSGIEAASVAWHPLGWEPVAFSEIDPFASAVLASRFPSIPNLGNMENYREWNVPAFDLLVGGTPCQSFSVAGLRKGLDDPRGNLALVYLGLLDRFRPRWCVWENVPGVLSSSGGRDFGAFLGGLAKLGYGFAYRVLDAQYVRVESHPWAVPQRRRRVFVVGHSGGDWKRAAEVLLEPEGVRGDPPTRRQAREEAPRGARGGATGGGIAGTVAAKWAKGTGGPAGDEAHNLVPSFVWPVEVIAPPVAGTLGGSNHSGGFRTTDPDTTGAFIPSFVWPVEVADPITANEGATYTHEGSRNFRLHNVVPSERRERVEPLPFDTTQVTSRLNRSVPKHGDPCHPLARGGHAPAVAFDTYNQSATGDVTQTLCSRGDTPGGSAHLVPAVAYAIQAGALRANPDAGPDGVGVQSALAYTLEARSEVQCVAALHATGNSNSFRLGNVSEALTRSEHKGHTVVLSPLSAVAFKASHYTRGKDGAPSDVAAPLSADADKGDQDTLVATAFEPRYFNRENKTGGAPSEVATLTASAAKAGDAAPTVYTLEIRGREDGRRLEYRQDGTANALRTSNGGRDGMGVGAVAAPTLTSTNDPSRSPQSTEVTQQVAAFHAATMAVRRLTPRECERLQGFPDDWTAITYRGKPAADGPRYKALGNSMAVNVMRFIGERLRRVR